MIFYFSGTGNSQLVAERLAEITGDALVAIHSHLKAGKIDSFPSERPLVFVAPTYAWRMPKVVEQWIRRSDFTGCRDAYFVLTCGGGCGNAAAYAERLCEEKGLEFRGLAPLVMPENYLAMFPTPDAAQCRALIANAQPRIAALAAHIQSGERFAAPPVSWTDRLESGPVNPLFYALFVHDKGFTVSDACISCGKCAQRCALNNIDLIQGKPVWKGHCTHCMACIGGCPVEAIEYKAKSKGRHRHYIMRDSPR